MLRFLSFKIALLFILFTAALNAQEIKYTGNWGTAGMTLTRQISSGVEINFSVPALNLEDVNVDGITLKAAKIPGIFLPNDAGKPDLAGTGRYIAIPQGATVTYRIVSSRSEVIKNINIAPAPVIPKDSDPSPLKYPKDNVFSKNENYPASPVIVSAPSKVRGVDVVMVGITPFQYNPVTKELTVYKDIKVEVSFIGGNGHFGDDAYRNIWWEPTLSDAILNYTSLPAIDFGKRYKDIMLADGYEYVIITPNGADFLAWADTIKAFRTKQGIKTGVFKLSAIGGNTVDIIKAWVTSVYNNWAVKPVAMCILADYGFDANSTIPAKLQPDSGYPDFASDNYYADVNNDEMPEIVFSRIIANNAAELQTLITKNFRYETNPPTNPYFYSHPITALGWQTERWFQICSEVLGGYFKYSQGKTPVRINKVYSGTPGTVWSTATNTATVVSYFGPTGRGYIPTTPDVLGGWDGGTATMVNNAMNTGSFLLQHRDHGMYTGWGEPAYTTSNIPQLTNTDLTFVYSINCQTGAYHNPSGCPANGSFAEVFTRYKYNGVNAGALGMVCPSEVSYSFVNDTYCWGMYDNMWPNFLPDYGITQIPNRDVKPAFGMAAGKYFLQQSSWPYNTGDKLVTYRLFHMFGDAFLNLYSEVPQNLTVSHAAVVLSGVSAFDITANAGAFIAVTQDTNILGTATGTGSSQSVSIPGTQLPGQILKVVVTKQNFYRYESSVSVIPPSGPYVIKDSVAINDASPLGNGNGLMDYGETNKLALRVKNVGSAVANNVNVKVSTTDPYIVMTDSVEVYGTISANSTMLKIDAFTYTVSNNIPDLRSVNFTVTATSGTDTWTSPLAIVSHTAKLKNGFSSINDSAGNNNGRWDPGETVMLRLTAKNIGSSQVNSVTGVLSESDPYVSINTNNISFGNIAAGDSTRKQYSVTSLSSTPAGYIATFMINYTGALGITNIDTVRCVVGQNIASIGTGTTGCDYPFYTYYDDARTQMLYTQSEILASGVAPGYVTKIGFDVTNASTQLMNGFMVKMKNFAGSSLSGYETTGMTTVFAPSTGYAIPGTGWQDIVLTSPIQWNGTDNLLIEICYDNNSFTTSTTINGTTNSLNQLKHQHQDLTTTSGCVAITAPSASYTARPNIRLTFSPILGVVGNNNGIPTEFSLAQNYPNPFNPVTKINYSVPRQSIVTMKVFDILGREVAVLVNDNLKPGYYSVDFDGSNFASGVYFYKLEAGVFSDVKRFILVK
ncbi:MAG: C25 family cysteine peptidase [Ignavibacteriae bacterium]|nr:C25 family cysteine peptidase [Ignavibacteriota bacterium]